MEQIKFNDLKTIGYSFKVSTNEVEDALQEEDIIIDGEVITKISFKDSKTNNSKVSSKDNYSTYTVIDYNEDVNYPNDLSGVQIVLSKNDSDKKKIIFYKHDFVKWSIDKKFKLPHETLLDGDDIEVLF